MKTIVVKSDKKKKERKSPEQQVMDTAFIEEELDLIEVNLEPAPDHEIFDTNDYGLTKEESVEMWQEKATLIATEIRNASLTVVTAFDAIKSVEEHFRKELETPLVILDAQLKREITVMFHAHILNLVGDKLDLSHHQINKLFERISPRGKSLLADLLSPNEGQENPYGNFVGMTGKRTD